MTKLSMEQRESLADIHESGNWGAVMALVEISIEHHKNRVCTADIGKSDRDLLLCKAKLEGAEDMKRLLANVREHINGVKKQA